jgi:hypothetical protein
MPETFPAHAREAHSLMITIADTEKAVISAQDGTGEKVRTTKIGSQQRRVVDVQPAETKLKRLTYGF